MVHKKHSGAEWALQKDGMNKDGEGVHLGGTLACCCLPLLTTVHLLKRVELKLMFKLQLSYAIGVLLQPAQQLECQQPCDATSAWDVSVSTHWAVWQVSKATHMQHPGLPEMKAEVVATLEMFPSVGCFFLCVFSVLDFRQRGLCGNLLGVSSLELQPNSSHATCSRAKCSWRIGAISPIEQQQSQATKIIGFADISEAWKTLGSEGRVAAEGFVPTKRHRKNEICTNITLLYIAIDLKIWLAWPLLFQNDIDKSWPAWGGSGSIQKYLAWPHLRRR